ncbi:MAG: phosphotransferase [Anaerolineae bacterium]|jgi:hygromycin-B 4-O-kinase|nr:phosphotransferase [Anaerolineae bacterium]
MALEQLIDIEQARAFLAQQLGTAPSEVISLGEGAWSQCFGFVHNGRNLVIRFGKYVDDFQKDQRAYKFANPDLPVPEVLEIGTALDGYFAISARVYGVPLESVTAEQWLTLVPAVVAALEVLRTTEISETAGFGGWNADRHAPHTSWRNRLLEVAEDKPDQRGYGWRKALTTSAEGQATFDWGLDLLEQVADDAVPRNLLHGDLTNRNVLVQGSQITGVLDWGCSTYGDHLYDLAWFEFWSPWQPQLNLEALRTALEQRWAESGYKPENEAARLKACYLHIGLEHLAYNAQLGNWMTLLEIAQRMRALVPEVA